MDKATFIERLTSHFKHQINAAERQALKEITGHKSRMDAAGFMEWLKTEQRAALSEPALNVYDQVLSKTPEESAQSLSSLINLDLGGKVDWGEQFKQAGRILTNWKPEQSENWKFKGYFIQYIKAIKADARARVFSQQIEQTMTRETFIQYLESELSDMVFNIGQVVDQELSLKKDHSTEAGFLEYLKNEEQRLLGLPELLGLPDVENFTPAKVAYLIASKYNKPGTDWEATYFEVLNPSNTHHLIAAFMKHKEAQVSLWKVKKSLEAVEPEQSSPEYFFSIEAMEKCFLAAHKCGLTHANGTWRFVEEKTFAISVFWRAAVAAGLAKADAPAYKVTEFLKERFQMESLGKGAIDKKKDIESFDKPGENTFQNLYNQLLHEMKK